MFTSLSKNRICAECGAEFTPVQPNQKYCSKDCAKKHKYESKNYICEVCGKSFTLRWHKNTCSKDCAEALRSQKSKAWQPKGEKKSPEFRQKCVERGISQETRLAQIASPKVGAFDTNIHAKSWVLQAPDGQIYNITNLQNFFRTHPELLPEGKTFHDAAKRIGSLKYSITGKSRSGKTWLGWRLIAWSDEFVNRDT